MSAGEQQLWVLILCGNHFLSVNAKVLAHGRASSGRVFNPGLVGASPTTDAKLWLNANCSQGVISSARRFAKPEVRGASPRESTISKQDVRDELLEVCRQLPMLSDGHNQFS